MERIPQTRICRKFCSFTLSSIFLLSPSVIAQDDPAKNGQSPQSKAVAAKATDAQNPCQPAGPFQIPIISIQDVTALSNTETPPFVQTLLKRPEIKNGAHEPSNKGIHVGQPKIYDDRSLELMLQSAEQRLRTLQLLDQTRIASNVGNIQGGSQSETGFGLQITGSPTPATVANTSTGDTLSSGTTQSSGNSLASNAGSTLTTGTNPAATSRSTTSSSAITGNSAASNNSSASNTSSNSLQTTTPSVTPVAPPPVSESGLALSTNGAPSASDILNEEMQLTYEIANLRLLLQGSLNDRFIPGSRILKQHATVGFPISIEPPNDPRYKNAVAEITAIVTTGPIFNTSEPPKTEVEANQSCPGVLRITVTAKNSQKCPTYQTGTLDLKIPTPEGACPDPPGLIAILPREKTYNVTNIKASNVNLAGAVTAKVVTVGATWSHRYKTFYVVQAQDTVAFETEPKLRDDLKGLDDFSTAFGWQFRPVLGETRVRSGVRETFAQLSFQVPDYPAAKLYGYVTVLAKWRSYDPKTGAVGKEIYDHGYEQQLHQQYAPATQTSTASSKDKKTPSVQWLGAWRLYQFDLTPELPDVDWEDIGGGKVSITANGRYLPGTNVIIGSSSIGTGSSDFLYDPERIRFVAPATQLIAGNDVYLEEQGGKVTRLEPKQESNLKIVSVEATPANNTESKVALKYEGDSFPSDKKKQPLVLIGTTVFGLSDHPIERVCSGQACTLSFEASTDLLRSAKQLRLKQLFAGPSPNASAIIQIKNGFTAAKPIVIAKTDTCTLYAISGSDFSEDLAVTVAEQDLVKKTVYQATECNFSSPKPTQPLATEKKKQEAVVPKPSSKSTVATEDRQKAPANADGKKKPTQSNATAPCLGSQGYYDLKLAPTMLLVAAPACLMKSSKAIEIYRGQNFETQFAILALEEERVVKPTIADATLKIGDLNFKLTGTNLDLIDPKSISYKETVLSAQKADDGSYIIVTVDKSFPQQPGFYPINMTLTDKKTKIAGLVQIVRPPTTIVSQ